MKSIPFVSVLSSAILCASLIACGDDDTSDKKDAGGSGGNGGSTQQEAGTGGDQQQDSATDSNSSATPCERICEHSLKAACPNTTLEDCMAQCGDQFGEVSGKCTDEINIALDCLTADPFTCDETGKASPHSNCVEEQNAAIKCELKARQ